MPTTLQLNPPVSQAESDFQYPANCNDFDAYFKVLAQAAENRLGFIKHQNVRLYIKTTINHDIG
jgi:hypothetical protein